MDTKLLSVIVPIYNSQTFLDKTVENILSADYSNLELILVDDGSKDNSLELCRKWQVIDNRVKVVHKENGGASSARNAGIDASQGEYIAFVDADDAIEPNMYSRIIHLMEDAEADLGWCSFDVNGEKVSCAQSTGAVMLEKDIINSIILPYFSINPYNAILKTYNNIFNKIVKTEIIRKNNLYFREDLRIGEDSEFLTRVLTYVKSVVFCDDALYHYIRQNPESLTSMCSTDLFPIEVKRFEIFKAMKEEFSPTPEITAMKFFNHEAECINHYSIFLGYRKYRDCAEVMWDCKYLKDAYKEFSEKAIPIVGKGIVYAHRKNSFLLYCLIGHQKNCFLRTKRFILKQLNSLKK